VSGKGGLYKILKPGKAGVLLESLDETKTRFIAGGSHKLSVLEEISIYTRTKEGTAPLLDVLKKIKKDFQNDLGVDQNSDSAELKAFMKAVLPEFDEDRVYVSDIKKLIRWYSVISQYAPEIFEQEAAKSEKA
ncbi:MAG: DUF5606 domain-containing protein, partial [Cyclobacteriaceae bacterium]|nr:DUF5606 domain-containing protein [Cyclobacteriaceae bacterium]